MTGKNIDVDESKQAITAESFVVYYNDNIPAHYPSATVEKLVEFQKGHPSLFKEDGSWYVHKHRKRLMDWLASHK